MAVMYREGTQAPRSIEAVLRDLQSPIHTEGVCGIVVDERGVMHLRLAGGASAMAQDKAYWRLMLNAVLQAQLVRSVTPACAHSSPPSSAPWPSARIERRAVPVAFVRDVCAALEPGTVALLVLGRAAILNATLEMLAPLGRAEVTRTELGDDTATQLLQFVRHKSGVSRAALSDTVACPHGGAFSGDIGQREPVVDAPDRLCA